MDGLASGSKVNEAEQKEMELAFKLFGQLIYNNKQIVAENATKKIHNGCKVLLDTGKTVDVSAFKTLNELFEKLVNLLGLDAIHNATSILYEDSHGTVKRIGDELFSDFATSARNLRIPLNECDLSVERKS
uniref:auxin response factor 16-like n=1 Tax=Erigeron canadensis TaxID=72917 RepID=UPI001CB99852|nr:auxin response factor 16-like [Erigeron canadensis]